MVAQYREEKAKGDYKDLKCFFECFFKFEKNFSCLIAAGRRFHILTAFSLSAG